MSEETIDDFANSLEGNLLAIRTLLKTGQYAFSSVRPVLIPKTEKDTFRPLRLSEIKDRVVQKALALKLEEILSKKFQLDNICSYAYLEKKRIDQAIGKMAEYYKDGYKFILEADIKKFFDNVNSAKLLDKIYRELPDKTLNKLLKQALEQSIGDLSNYAPRHHHYFLDSMQGIPQGNSLSPLLANIYLADFDQRMIREKIKMIRYADDFIIMCKSVDEAKLALEIAKDEIEVKLGLSLHPLAKPIHAQTSKTRIINPAMHPFSFLSIRFDGKQLWVNPDKLSNLLTKINGVTDLSQYANDPKFHGLITVLKRLKNLTEGWLSAFKYVDIDRNFKEIDDHINFKLLSILLKMGFKLRESHLDERKIKSTGKVVQLLKDTQRVNTGIPLCKTFVDSLERQKIEI